MGGSSAAGNSVGGVGGGTTNFASALAGHGGGLGGSSSSFGQFDGADLVAALGSAAGSSSSSFPSLGNPKGPPEPPKDRSTLATMRVIRRNLVYAVGMPPNIAIEETLRKSEYFGQYGKISKIVINRNQNPGDPRRASASAYVTFAHKVRVVVPFLENLIVLPSALFSFLENSRITNRGGSLRVCRLSIS